MKYVKKSNITIVAYFLFIAISFIYYLFNINIYFEKMQNAEKEKNPALCEKISNNYWRNECYFNLAYQLHNRRICDRISNSDAKLECKSDLLWGYEKFTKNRLISRNTVILIVVIISFFLPFGFHWFKRKHDQLKKKISDRWTGVADILIWIISIFGILLLMLLAPIRDSDLRYLYSSYLWFVLPSLASGILYSIFKAYEKNR